jgi:serine/threonine protein kinase
MKTTHLESDSRYEAPEFQAIHQHTYYSDVWSLGIVIWQCLSGKLPFNLADFVGPKSDGAKKIRELLQQKKIPGNLSETGGVGMIVQLCWNSRANLRPPAAGLVVMLQQLYVQVPENTPSEEIEQPDLEVADIQRRLVEDIERARALNPPGKATELILPHGLKVSQREFEVLFAEDSWDSVKSYVVGAALFWKIVNPPVPVEGSVDVFTSPQLLSDDIGE